MTNIFVISDTHFNHANILNFQNDMGKPIRQGFNDLDDMNEQMIANWNAVVGVSDKVYHLGDVYFGSSAAADTILSRLNGKKRLIVGNHDKLKDPVLHRHFQKISMWRIFKEFSVVLSHVPLHQSTIGEGSQFNVHGHIHQNQPPSDQHVCVCVEHVNYTPRDLETLVTNHANNLGVTLAQTGFRDN